MVLADDGPRCSCRRCDSDESLARNLKDTKLSSTRPSVSSSEKPKATRMGPTRPETTQGSPPRGLLVSPGDSSGQETHLARRVIPQPKRVARGVILLPARGDLETLLTPQESPREWFSSPQEAIWRLLTPQESPREWFSSPQEAIWRLLTPQESPREWFSSPQEAIWRLSSAFLGLLVSPGYSPRSFSDYSSRQGTLLSVSQTTRLARGVVTHPGRVAKGVILLPSRGLGSRTIRRPMRLRRHHIANTETISRVTRNIFGMLLCLFAGLHHKNVSSRLQYSAQPSPKRLLVFEAANIIDESSTTYSVCHGHRIISSTGRTYCRLPQWRLLSRRQGKSSI